jgi:hypothetical protein
MANTNSTALVQNIDRLPAALLGASREQLDGLLSRGFTAFERGCLEFAYKALRLDSLDDSLFDQWGAVTLPDDCSAREMAIFSMADACIESAMTMH